MGRRGDDRPLALFVDRRDLARAADLLRAYGQRIPGPEARRQPPAVRDLLHDAAGEDRVLQLALALLEVIDGTFPTLLSDQGVQQTLTLTSIQCHERAGEPEDYGAEAEKYRSA